MKGLYAILALVDKPTTVETRGRRLFVLERGAYVYVGSALSGIEQRIARHLSPSKKHFWHVDYLLDHAVVHKVFCAETDSDKECEVARALSERLSSVPGFGCSDCRCSSHLFYSKNGDTLEKVVVSVLNKQGLSALDYQSADPIPLRTLFPQPSPPPAFRGSRSQG